MVILYIEVKQILLHSFGQSSELSGLIFKVGHLSEAVD